MVSLDPMQMRILWYVLAGFVLGFITSTLWEWVYFRKRRLERQAVFGKGAEFTTAWRSVSAAAPTGAANQPTLDQNSARRGETPPATSDDLLWQTSAYRSPRVFLDSEKGDIRAEPVAPEPSVAPVAAAVRVAPAELDPTPVIPQPAIVLAQPADQVDATVEATLLPQPIAPPLTVVERSSPNVVRPIGSLERSELPGAMRLRTLLEQTNHELPAAEAAVGLMRPALSPPVGALMPAADAEPAAVTVVNQWTVPRSAGYPDDLTKIQGIGEAYKRRLYAAGIYTWQQVANSAAEQLRSVTKAKPNARPEAWKTRAQELAQKFNRTAALYDGPLPDDLTKVSGIGPTYADSLYRAGICTYEQLASVTPPELAAILPTPAIGNEFNFPDWIRQAAQWANMKQKNLRLLP
ncbi:MAG: helix-hairpin-helix domain-containing protein [Caldilineaceae bacterium]